VAGGLGALGMAGHVFLDGVALGISFQVSKALGLTVFIALLAHAFSDGLNTVSLLIKSGKWTKSSFSLLGVDAVMRISGAALGSIITLSDKSVGIYLAVFSGFVIYLATSHILPEAHSRHPSRLTMLATVIGVIAMWLIVGNIGE
jgi:ZIP family zinc transporter